MQLMQKEDASAGHWVGLTICLSLPKTDSVYAYGLVVIINSTNFFLKSGPNLSSKS